MVDTATIMTAVGSAAAGGITTGWIAKTLITNYLRKNEDQHSRWRESINGLKDSIQEQKTSISVINTKLDYLNNIRKDVDDIKRTCISHKISEG